VKNWTLCRIPLGEITKNLEAMNAHCSKPDVQNLIKKVRKQELHGMTKVRALLHFLENYTNDDGPLEPSSKYWFDP
jgi:hypothetical protein